MSIRQVMVDEYHMNGIRENRLRVSEFAGRCHLEILNDAGEIQASAEVLWGDLERAWQAVRR